MLTAKQAYKLLKQEVYYDNIDLFKRKQIADFECSNDFNERLDSIESCIDEDEGVSILDSHLFNKWVSEIDFRIIPKEIHIQEENDSLKSNHNESTFVSNLRTYNNYNLSKVNYFISAPVELYILDVIWTNLYGIKLEEVFHGNCLGNRLNHSENCDIGLFKIYHRQYSKWRDDAIEKTKKSLENNINVVLVGLDIKEFFYHIVIDWDRLHNEAVTDNNNNKDFFYIIPIIYAQYKEVIKRYLKITHPELPGKSCIPIGLSSSKVVANWSLNTFDHNVQSKLKPLYYGRYVDDILIVLQNTGDSLIDFESVLDKYFLNKIFESDKDYEGNVIFRLKEKNEFIIQKSKFICHYFDAQHSHASLDAFSKELAEQASEFQFLPVDFEDESIEEKAYDVIYKGSINKFRSIIGLHENSTELSKHLSRKITSILLCDCNLDDQYIGELFRFYKGKNIFDFIRLWEKVFTLLVINNDENKIEKFYNRCKKIIINLDDFKFNSKNNLDIMSVNRLLRKTHRDLEDYLDIAILMPLSLKSYEYKAKSKKLDKIYSQLDNHLVFRKSNLIRHHFVAWPLLNYTEFQGDLILNDISKIIVEKKTINKKKIRWSPRYIHESEYHFFSFVFKDHSVDTWLTKNFLEDNIYSNNNQRKSFTIKDKIISVSIKEKLLKDNQMNIGIANVKISDNDVLGCYHPMKMPNLSRKRQNELFNILNIGKEEKCDVIVLPEVSVPVQWLPSLQKFVRVNQIALVFGLEHISLNKIVSNNVAVLLPYTDTDNYNRCITSLRLKNYYSPNEIKEFHKYGLDKNQPKPKYYELFKWRDCSFSVYNCFELTDIHHRGLMKSKIDLLVSVTWNKDTNYYSNIVESSVRDLYCYMVNVNTSQYGDSRIISPKKTELMNLVQIKGGDNTTLITKKLDLSALRDMQIRKDYNYENNNNYKPLPAGYDENDDVHYRVSNFESNLVITQIIAEENDNGIIEQDDDIVF